MTFLAPLDSQELYFLLGIGALFALSGLFLMIRPPRSDGATRIEVLGLKFNASSGGLVVFLIGAGFVSLPMLAPPAAAVAAAPVRTVAAGADTVAAATAGPRAVPSAGGEFITLRRADAAEVEENDDQFSANHVAVGSAVAGTVAYGDPDWFAFRVDLAAGQRIAIRLRSTDKTGSCWAALFDAREENVGSWYFVDAPGAHNVGTEIGKNGHFMLMLDAAEGAVCSYDLFVDYA